MIMSYMLAVRCENANCDCKLRLWRLSHCVRIRIVLQIVSLLSSLSLGLLYFNMVYNFISILFLQHGCCRFSVVIIIST